MKPVIFNGHSGWLHPADGNNGVVLCNPFGHEALWLHRAMRELTDRLVARGVPVLRFDYRGTGDSIDGQTLLRPSEWADEVLEAIAYLKSVTAVEQVSLAGFRLGATVAALAARRCDIKSIAMLAPVRSLRLFLREMNALQRIWLEGACVGQDEVTPPGARDFMGHRVSAEALETIGSLDLCDEPMLPAQRILIAHSGQPDGSRTLSAHYELNGAFVESVDFENYAQLLQTSWLSELPETLLDKVADWLSTDVEPCVHAPKATVDANPVLVTASAIEYPLQLRERGIFSVLCEPATRSPTDEPPPVLLIANTAATHHVGDGRFGVELSRALADRGFASLRVDARGLGDSHYAASGHPGQTVLDAIGADLSWAADWLIERGYRDIVVFGICSGAYTALQATRLNRARAVRGLVMVNPSAFVLPDGCTMQGAAERRLGSPRTYLRSLMRVEKWMEVMRGNARLGLALRTIWRHAAAHAQDLAAAWSGEKLCPPTDRSKVRALFQRLDATGVHVRLLFSAQDHSIGQFHLHFGMHGRLMEKLARAQASIVSNMDHEVLSRIARQNVTAVCEEVLRTTHLAAAANGKVTTVVRKRGGPPIEEYSPPADTSATKARSRIANRKSPLSPTSRRTKDSA
ncbi:alpha/beta fold hydrolase [Paraburkholderia phytofirmans]|uniref:Alpha/beta fold hydrolase n=1 Tax=Paraburkholderia phytofirmans TaxID=261302 RepID=A0ABW9BJ87_9BURK